MINWEIQCKDCGKCCGPVPFEEEFLKTHNYLFQEPAVVKELYGKFVPITDSLMCVFLHRKNKKCLIYEQRPDVCKLQGTIPQLPCPFVKVKEK